LEILALRHQIGVLQRSVKTPETDASRSTPVGLALDHVAELEIRFIMKASTVVG
jgi:hypothetical protein